jgi:hypothetical protein
MNHVATRPSARNRSRALALAVMAAVSGDTSGFAADLQFNRDIRPILSEACFHCHGPDPGTRKAGLRLDTREGFFAPTAKRGPAVVAGKPDDSPLWQRLITTDPDDVMPPPESHKELKPEQKAAIQAWIRQGAEWQPHWAFIRPERPTPPAVPGGMAARVRNPIDQFIFARLAVKGLTPAPEADRRTLARRAALDVTGLPPKREWVEAFVADSRPDAYERYVDRLMDLPQWGEHRGRYWLDAARYADTHGLHFDNYREMWPYRDWVIAAFNHNQPFDQFTVEQLAGDLLPSPTDDQVIATGFHRCNMTTNEGGTIEEENLANYANDRVTTTSWVWLGLTANCAACHDHKFDPIPTRDFYSMAAFFRNTTQPGLDGNVKDSSPSITVIRDMAQRARWEQLPPQIDAAKERVATRKTEAQPVFDRWASNFKPAEIERELNGDTLRARLALTEGQGQQAGAVCGPVERSYRFIGDVVWKPEGRLGAAAHFQAGGSIELPDLGDFERDEAFSYGGWVFVPAGFNENAAIMARMDQKNEHRGWDLWYQQGQIAAHFIHRWPENALKVRTRERVAKKNQWQHIFVTYDGSGRPEGVKIYLDGVSQSLEAEGGKEVTASIKTATPLRLGQRSDGNHFTGGALQDVRLYARALRPAEVRAVAQWPDWTEQAGKALAEWKPEVRTNIFNFFLETRYEPFQEARRQLVSLEKERDGIRLANPITHVQIEKKDSMPMANVLFRGQYDQKRDAVSGAVFSALNPLPMGAPTNRLGLAQWLVSPDNPLTARVTVNRFWAELFGVGFVKTAEDFGIMGETPSNQELLDWLAVDFQQNGWDVKRLYRLMLTSATYRQSAATTPEKLEKDPANRLLSRGPRFRMDAEMVRDHALAASGLLVARVGGPSVKPYQPEGVWEAVAMPESNTKRYQAESGERLYRRSMYTFWKRAAPPASMDIFNAPSRETCSVRRERTNTPLQALATLNDPQMVEAARHLAELALRTGRDDLAAALDVMARRLLSRPLRTAEMAVVKQSWETLLAHYRQNTGEAEALLKVGESRPTTDEPAPRLAAMTMVANQLMNLDEVLNK